MFFENKVSRNWESKSFDLFVLNDKKVSVTETLYIRIKVHYISFTRSFGVQCSSQIQLGKYLDSDKVTELSTTVYCSCD